VACPKSYHHGFDCVKGEVEFMCILGYYYHESIPVPCPKRSFCPPGITSTLAASKD
jgi:hypothetical protein